MYSTATIFGLVMLTSLALCSIIPLRTRPSENKRRDP
jgi:hypothetical protein